MSKTTLCANSWEPCLSRVLPRMMVTCFAVPTSAALLPETRPAA
ncbi:hypothetical protein SFUMM280S_01407 [Streptomyces fumanus]